MENQSLAVKIIATGAANTQVLLEGQLTVRNAEIFKREILSALTNSQNLELIFKNITKTDMAFLQLLVALQKSADSLGKKVLLNTNEAACIQAAIKNSGLAVTVPANIKA